MRYGSRKLDVTHPLASDLLLSYLNVAFLADLALVTDSLVFSAQTFPVLCRTEDLFAEKTVAFGFKGTVVYRFGLEDLAV